MKERKALLIGVPEYENKSFRNLPVVVSDLMLLHKALESSDYEVHMLGIGDNKASSRFKIIKAVRSFCLDARKGMTLVIYYSGHGVHYKGIDYLVPPDGSIEDQFSLTESLVPLDFSSVFDSSKAETILFFSDACRDGLEPARNPDSKAIISPDMNRWGRGNIIQAKKRETAYIYSCSPGEVSRFFFEEGNKDNSSYFTRALSKVLDRQYPAQTFGEVRQALQEELNRLTNTYQKPFQTIRIKGEFAADNRLNDRIICDGTEDPLQSSHKANSWLEAAEKSVIWNLAEDVNAPFKSKIKEHALELIVVIYEECVVILRELENDPWIDIEFPVRLLERIEFLCKESSESLCLSLGEIALLITTPFFHVGIRLSGLRAASRANASSLELTGKATGLRGSLERYYRSIPFQVSRVKGLEQEHPDDANSLATWIIHRWLLRDPEVWLPPPQGFIDKQLWSNLTQPKDVDLTKVFEQERLLELSHCVIADSERIERSDRRNALRAKLTIMGGNVHEQIIREKLLAYIIALASRMALDISTLSDVLVEHIGTSDSIDPQNVIETICEATWNPVAQSRSLSTICQHPAVDYVLRMHVQDAEDLLYSIQLKVHDEQDGLDALNRLPARLTTDEIKPAIKEDDCPVYQTPHLRFRLDQKKIRELLMGEKIYGDPSLAIRELYQNALDACRYRSARLEYLKKIGQRVFPWEGEIIFRQDMDSDGRPYIECEDNGIGMGHTELTKCFARAGKRFADTSEFLEEQADWLQCDEPVRLYPNSQFGVGVFSYFMLAEEIHLQTCRLDRFGQPKQCLEARISSGGSLFRIYPSDARNDAGTTIRLYLKHIKDGDDSARDSILEASCLSTLTKVLRVADYKTSILEQGKVVYWMPGQLGHHKKNNERSRDNASAISEYPTDSPNLWWSRYKNGDMLSDGITTNSRLDYAIVNLRHEYKPELTVDRLRIRKYDEAYVDDLLLANIASLSACPEWMDYEWLWTFAESHPHLADRLVEILSSKDVYLPISHQDKDQKSLKNRKVRVEIVRCLPADRQVSDCIQDGLCRTRGLLPVPLMALRCAIWRQAGLEDNFSGVRYESFPFPSATEWIKKHSIILSQKLNSRAPWLEGQVSLAQVLCAAVTVREPLPYVVDVLEQYSSLLELDLSRVLHFDWPLVQPDKVDEKLVFGILNPHLKKRKRDKKFYFNDFFRAAAKLEVSMPNLLERLENYLPVLEIPWDLPELSSLSNEILSNEDLVIASQSFDSKEPYISGEIQLIHVFGAASAIQKSPAYIFSRLQVYAHLFGAKLLEVEIAEQLKQTSDANDRILLSRKLNGIGPWLEANVSIGHILRGAAKIGITPSEVVLRLRFYQPSLEFNIPTLEASNLLSDPIDKIDSCLLTLGLDGKPPWLAGKVSPAHLVGAASTFQITIDDAFQRLQKYSEFVGFQLPEKGVVSRLSQIFNEIDACILSSNLDNRHPWLHGKISIQHVVKASLILRKSASKIVERLHDYQEIMRYDLSELKDLALPKKVPEVKDLEILASTNSKGKLKWIKEFSKSQLFTTSVALELSLFEVGSRLKYYAKWLEIRLPDLDFQLLSDVVLDDPERTILLSRLGNKDKGGPLVFFSHCDQPNLWANKIFSAALELDVSPSLVLDSLTTYTQMLDLGLPALNSSISSTGSIDRLDRFILSKDIDGRQPWLQRVSGIHIFSAALKLRISPFDVVHRLQRYEQLFGIELPEVSSEILPETSPDVLDGEIFKGIFLLSEKTPKKDSTYHVPLGFVIKTAFELSQPISLVLERIQKYSALVGVAAPIRDVSTYDLSEDVPNQVDCLLFSENLDASSPWIAATDSSDRQILSVAWLTGIAESKLKDRLKVLISGLY